jgi:hypothetical protein
MSNNSLLAWQVIGSYVQGVGAVLTRTGRRDMERTQVTQGFRIYDSKGRELGYRVVTWQENGLFCGYACATRDGVPFGASRPNKVRSTAEALDRDLAKQVKAALKRYELLSAAGKL